ncbi:MAG: HAD-IIIA family hydrolase, partial [Candidatus Omnitrophica bacterium]|nr:HAD-IIIA family hydrolase [Candidatus Omnitrophota bacterium]
MEKAIFLDRDGVINKLVFNQKTKEYGAPLCENDLKFYPWAHKVLGKFKGMDYLLFLISNQPDYAKGHTSLKNIRAIHARLHRYFGVKGIRVSGYFYCFHHPEGKVAKYRLDCACRKPKPYFALKAKEKYGLDMRKSWFIGDCDSDIFCGKAAGLKTILINERHTRDKRGRS